MYRFWTFLHKKAIFKKEMLYNIQNLANTYKFADYFMLKVYKKLPPLFKANSLFQSLVSVVTSVFFGSKFMLRRRLPARDNKIYYVFIEHI